jgi:mono/diheme cytochrome c family protein
VLTTIIVIVLVAVAVLYAAVPLLVPRQVDPLPNERDPVLQDLEEDREALFRAIRELEARDDMAAARREQLRARYEAKAAGVLRAIDERRALLDGVRDTDARPVRRGLPWAPLGLLAAMAVSAIALGPFVLPRVGQDATVTTFFAEDLRRAEALRDLQRAAERDPGVPTLMALADAYWQLEDAPQAEATYRRVLLQAEADGAGTAPALAYRRLAMLAVQDDLELAREYLALARRADPTDAETLFALAELSFATGELAVAAEAFRAYLDTPEGEGDEEAATRLALVERIGPALDALAAERSHEALDALAEIFWDEGAIDQAVELYFEVLTQHDPRDEVALARTGQLLFLRGRMDDAIGVLERAAEVAGGVDRLEPQASLFLGNAYYSEGDDDAAISAWQGHIAAVGEAEAGRVPGLIAAAEARRDGEGVADADLPSQLAEVAPPAAEGAPSSDTAAGGPRSIRPTTERATAALEDPDELLALGPELYDLYCAMCHGPEAGGGSGPRLAGNARAANTANVRSAVTFGRGIMPGFGAILEPDEIEVLVRWLATEVAAPR